jgi:Na+(H+)/acetate symporter ActP
MTPPAPPVWNEPSKHQKTVAFVVAILVLVALLASAMFGVLPHQYTGDIVKLAIAVAGAGFTLFLTGYFEHVGASGALGAP